MAKQIDYTLQDAAVILEAINNNKPALTAKNFSAAKEEALTVAYADAKQKNAAQTKAVKNVTEQTAEQDKAFSNLMGLISRVQKAAKSAFNGDAALLKKFRIGDKQPGTVKALLSWGEYFNRLIPEYNTVLLENGLVQEDVSGFITAYNRLMAADAGQESAKKQQASATMARDKAIEVLKEQLTKTRNFVKAAFAGNNEILVQFKPIPKGRGGAGSDGGENNNPPAGQ